MNSAARLEFSGMKSIILEDTEDTQDEAIEMKVQSDNHDVVKNSSTELNKVSKLKMNSNRTKRRKARKQLEYNVTQEDSLYEMKQISKSFHNMASGLQAFSRYVPRDIVLELLKGNSHSGKSIYLKSGNYMCIFVMG